MTAEQNISTGKITALIGVVSSVITIVLTVFNTYTKWQIDAADQRLKERGQELEAIFKQRTADIEALKERTSRYTFVKTLFQDLESNDSKKQTLTINLIRLTLTEGESERLFRGFTNSPDQTLQKVGNEGIAVIQKEKSSAQVAAEKEREGFLYLREKKFDDALKAFEAAEKSFPTYHNVYEISNLLRKERGNFSNPEARKRILKRIIDEYSWGMPDDIKDQLRKISDSNT
ncbi:hypothetical protein MSj_03446 [Microcystis aeruginosa Sj]|jgi:tetratricopeptide (TPR) repeat protein|uniref:Uncharacterized protein n=1 Tax=Microcystis aeruginosa Sj TaxID=1979544 RepID=A0A2Z6UVM7_MICAE|nr:tetratricopeptide repeat protein [Microcystis aeruginosa]MDB9414442.1 tetratricopeptide repeat protein [Microcystis aeruginosa CS-567/02]GBL11936.1 hypothetical protein MSj_03446 [Microcystis aeruginosa Sj]